LAEIAQQKVKVVAQPWEPNDYDKAQTWSSLMAWVYEKTLNMNDMRLRARLDGAIYGYYIGKYYWEPRARWLRDKRQWQGEVRATLIPPPFFGFDPEAEKLEGAAYIYTQRRVRLDELVRQWPKFDEQIRKAASQKPDELSQIGSYLTQQIASLQDESDSGPDRSSSIRGRVAKFLQSLWFMKKDKLGEVQEQVREQAPAYVTLQEFFVHDGRTVEEVTRTKRKVADMVASGEYVEDGAAVRDKAGKLLNPEDWPADEKRRSDIPKFPFGRRIVRVGDTILNPDEKGQVWDYERWPYAVGVNAPLPHTMIGENSVEPARDIQDYINTLMAHFQNYVANFSDPRMVVEMGALAKDPECKNVAQHVVSKAGSVILAAEGRAGGITSLQPAQMPGAVFNIYDLYVRQIQNQTGASQVSLGQETERKETATAISQYAQQSQLRSGLVSVLLDTWTLESMEIVNEILHRRMTAGEKARIVGDRREKSVAEIDNGLLSLEHDLALEVVTALPLAKQQKKMEMAELFGMVGIGILPELLDAFEVPDKEAVLGRVEEWQQFQQFIQQMQQQQGQNQPREEPSNA